MSSRLSSLLVQQGLVGVGALQDALALQVVRGGTLDTILLERALVDESKLIQLLSQISGYPPIDPATLDKATSSVASEIPEKTARKLGICPVMREEDRLFVVSSEATDKIALPELAYELNCVVVPFAATEVRVEQACSLVYGTELSTRFAKLLAKCEERPPKVAWTPPAASDPPQEPPVVAEHLQPSPDSPGDQPAASDAPVSDGPTAIETPAPPVPAGQAKAPAEVPAAPAGAQSEPASETQARGSASHSEPLDRSEPAEPSAESERPSSSPTKTAQRTAPARPQQRTPTDRFPFVVASVPVGDSPAEADEGQSSAASSEQGPTKEAPAAARANTTALAPDGAAFELDRATDREEVLLTLLRAFHHHLAVVHLYGVAKGSELVGRYRLVDESLDAGAIRDTRVGLERNSQLARCVRDGTLHVGPTPYADATGALLQRLGLEAPHIAIIPICLRGRTVCLFIGHQRQDIISHTARTPLSRLASAGAQSLARLIVRKKRRTAEIEAEQLAAATAPPAELPSEISGEIPDVTDGFDDPAKTGPIPMPPPSPHEKVIIDFDVSITTRSIEELVDSLDSRPEMASDALTELRRRSKSAVQWLLSNFPGKLRFKRSDVSELPDVGNCSAVLQALVAIGRSVIPRLAPLLVGGDEQVRFFATYMLSALTYPETVSLLARRLRDPSLSVRQAAIYGLRRSRELEQFPLIVEELRADLSHPDTRPQLAAMEALAALGDVVATPSLIALLNDDRPDLADTAHRALVQLTKHDFGRKPQPWMTWWNRNRHRHRVEWMIDGLTNDTAEIREQAFVELRDLTGLDFDYDPELPAQQREQIRHRFLQWWTDTGLYDFGRFA